MESVQRSTVGTVVTVGMVTHHDPVASGGVAIVEVEATPPVWALTLLEGRLEDDVIFITVSTAGVT